MFWDSWILVLCRLTNYFTLIAKEKLHFSFYCCLVKEEQLAVWRLVAYRLIAYKNNKCN